MRKLIRSRALVDKLGHETGKYNWTECFYLFGFLIRSVQVRNLDYDEASEIFDDLYDINFNHDNYDYWHRSITYRLTRK